MGPCERGPGSELGQWPHMCGRRPARGRRMKYHACIHVHNMYIWRMADAHATRTVGAANCGRIAVVRRLPVQLWDASVVGCLPVVRLWGASLCSCWMPLIWWGRVLVRHTCHNAVHHSGHLLSQLQQFGLSLQRGRPHRPICRPGRDESGLEECAWRRYDGVLHGGPTSLSIAIPNSTCCSLRVVVSPPILPSAICTSANTLRLVASSRSSKILLSRSISS